MAHRVRLTREITRTRINACSQLADDPVGDGNLSVETNSTNISENSGLEVLGDGGPSKSHRTPATLLLTVFAVLALGLYLRSRQSMAGYMFDDWRYIGRRQDLTFRSLIIDHNSHLSVVPAIVYLSIFYLFGLPGQAAFNVVAIVGHVATIALMAIIVGRRHGNVAAALAFVLVGASGLGADVWNWGTNIGFSASVFFVIAAVICFDQYVSSSENRWRVGMFLCLLAATASSGAGIAGLLVSLVMIAASPARRRLWWVVLTPLGLYLVWNLKYGSGGQVPTIGVWKSVTFVVDGMAWSASSPFGLGVYWGYAVMLAVVALVAFQLLRRPFSARRYFWVAYLVVFWAMTAYRRGFYGGPDVSRYRWVGSIALVLVFAELLPRWSPTRKIQVRVAVAGLVMTPVFIARTEPQLEYVSNFSRGFVSYEKLRDAIALGLSEKIADDVGIHNSLGTPTITADLYFNAVRKFGAPPSLPVANLSRPEYAEKSDTTLADFGFFERVLVRHDAECSTSGQVTSVTVAGGEGIHLDVGVPSTVVMTRFLEPGSQRPFNTHRLEPGTYLLRFAPDRLVRPLSLVVIEGRISQCR